MKTLISYYQEIKDKLKTQLEGVEKPEQVAQIIQNELNKLADFNGDYLTGLTPLQARLATVMLKMLNQYTNILILVTIPNSTPNISGTTNNTNLRSQSEVDLAELTTDTSLPLAQISHLQKSLKTLTSLDYYKKALLQQAQQNREVISSLLAGGLTGTLAGGYSWGIIGAITGAAIGKIVQQTKFSENKDGNSHTEAEQKELKIDINIDKLLDHLSQAFQSIDMTVAAYGSREEKALGSGLENNLDLLEYLQDLMADTLDGQTQLPTAVRRRIEQAATILRHYGIETRVYKPAQENITEQDVLSMFYFEPSLDPQVKDYITLKHALVKDEQVLLPGCVIEPGT